MMCSRVLFYETLATTQHAAPFELPPRRKFYLIGESGEPSEIEPEADSDS